VRKRAGEKCIKISFMTFTLSKYFSGNKIKEDKMHKHEACMEGKKNAHTVLVGRSGLD
jgi:hypothetical protein